MAESDEIGEVFRPEDMGDDPRRIIIMRILVHALELVEAGANANDVINGLFGAITTIAWRMKADPHALRESYKAEARHVVANFRRLELGHAEPAGSA